MYFLDSGSSFSAKRLRDFYKQSEALQKYKKLIPLETIFKRIHVIPVFDHAMLITTLEQEFNSPVIFIIDNITDILAPLMNKTSKGNVVARTLTLLNDMIRKYHVPIIVINSTVSAFSSALTHSNMKSIYGTTLKPALGQIWASGLTNRLIFSPPLESIRKTYAILTGMTCEGSNGDDVWTISLVNGTVFEARGTIIEGVINGVSLKTMLYYGKHDLKCTEIGS